MPELKRLTFLSAGALLLFGCVVTPDMQGGASSITGSFTPEQAKELMAQKKVLPATRITTRTSRNATGGRSSARVFATSPGLPRNCVGPKLFQRYIYLVLWKGSSGD